MSNRIHAQMLGLLAMTLPLAACAQTTAPSAPTEQVAAARPQAPAAPLVSGLPDFTQLVDQVGPGVVNVETIIGARRNPRMVNGPGMDDMPEFFRRFFGPDFQMPGPGQQAPDSGPRGRGMGSGFIISNDGYVLTNHHVIDGAESVKVKLSDRREFTAKVVGSDAQYDVALLKIEGRNLPTVRVGDSNTLKPGQWVVAIGSPFGLDHSVTAGIVSALGRSTGGQEQRYVPFIQTDVAINQGNSGGPLLNTRGEVVGINSQIFSASGGYMGISFAIPIDLAMNAVDQIKKTGKVSRGQLGVMVGAINADAAEGLKLPDGRGALVNQLVPDSAAAKAGIEVGDVIRSVNGTEINSSSDLPPLIGAMAPGSKVRMGILRDGRARDITVTLSELAEDAQGATPAAGSADEAKPQVGANALLGLDVADLTAPERRQLGLGANEGVRITRVNSQAGREAQLAPGMVVLQVGRTPVGSVAALNRELAGYKKGDVVMLLVRAGANSAFVAIRAGD
ncbi:DegQ family serine endoprotease [Stenotrophomonas sp. MH1]|uniref:Probable periplasmic serine endoprotease DegP-like n=1 Tax=Stenotrophomonas capsici TaxID=3110230 RepID=A0ABU5V667_9GAMM|nr:MULTISPECIES: DegQ family serine endoprotease [unclassified Stenotrophomonas]MBD9537775.1 DegQ family serine endoprotease [Stenotrophomonas sp. STM01]MEA5668857.1 DegQ family serine endoprotease [Stenotrophomonas sp. MH1]